MASKSLLRIAPGELAPLTPERAWRYADMILDRAHDRLIAIREDHEKATLERHGEAQDIPGDVLAQAFFTMMRARKACRQGREQDAFALYDSIKLTPTTTQ